MLQLHLRRKPRLDEAEKPFWISFSDLMTALMVLFLVTMTVALLGITQGLRKTDEMRQGRNEAIRTCLDELHTLTQQPAYAGVRLRGQTLEFGSLAEFNKDGNELTSSQAVFLRAFVSQVLGMAQLPGCHTWLKRFVVEGYASPEGSYLYNLNLSLERSQRFLCVLLDASAPDALTRSERQSVRELFLVGGSSFNSPILNQPEKSRRVELRLEFLEDHARCEAGSVGCSPTARQAIAWDDDVKCPVVKR